MNKNPNKCNFTARLNQEFRVDDEQRVINFDWILIKKDNLLAIIVGINPLRQHLFSFK